MHFVNTKWQQILLGVLGLTFILYLFQVLKPNPYRTGNVTTFNFTSDALQETRHGWLYLPPNYASSKDHYPILIMHDGQNVFDGSTSTHTGMEWRVDETLERMILTGEIPPLVVVAIDSTPTRLDDFLPERVIVNGVDEGGNANNYAAMLIKELLPYLHDQYRLKTGPQNTFVGGSSYGGVLSFYLAMNHADIFGAALIVSPSAGWNNRWMKRTADALFWKKDVKLWLDIGYGEGGVEEFMATAEALQRKGWRIPYDMNVVVDGGFHVEAAWARRFPAMMTWLFNEAVFTQEPSQ